MLAAIEMDRDVEHKCIRNKEGGQKNFPLAKWHASTSFVWRLSMIQQKHTNKAPTTKVLSTSEHLLLQLLFLYQENIIAIVSDSTWVNFCKGICKKSWNQVFLFAKNYCTAFSDSSPVTDSIQCVISIWWEFSRICLSQVILIGSDLSPLTWLQLWKWVTPTVYLLETTTDKSEANRWMQRNNIHSSLLWQRQPQNCIPFFHTGNL